jgi:GntR family transcriptional regulator
VMAREKRRRGRSGEPELPLYRQVVDSLRTEIRSGKHPVGDLLPTESELRERFGVSRHTVREALRQLRDEGLVASRQGSGTTVLEPGSATRFVQEIASINDLITYADELRYAVDSTGMLVADAALSARLGCEPGTRWLRVEGYRHLRGQSEPVAWTEVFIHADYAGVALYLGRRPGPIYLWVEEMYGQRVEAVHQTLSARAASEEIAPTLGIEPGVTMFEARRTYRLADGAVAVIAVTLHPAERFVHSMVLRRVRS